MANKNIVITDEKKDAEEGLERKLSFYDGSMASEGIEDTLRSTPGGLMGASDEDIPALMANNYEIVRLHEAIAAGVREGMTSAEMVMHAQPLLDQIKGWNVTFDAKLTLFKRITSRVIVPVVKENASRKPPRYIGFQKMPEFSALSEEALANDLDYDAIEFEIHGGNPIDLVIQDVVLEHNSSKEHDVNSPLEMETFEPIFTDNVTPIADLEDDTGVNNEIADKLNQVNIGVPSEPVNATANDQIDLSDIINSIEREESVRKVPIDPSAINDRQVPIKDQSLPQSLGQSITIKERFSPGSSETTAELLIKIDYLEKRVQNMEEVIQGLSAKQELAAQSLAGLDAEATATHEHYATLSKLYHHQSDEVKRHSGLIHDLERKYRLLEAVTPTEATKLSQDELPVKAPPIKSTKDQEALSIYLQSKDFMVPPDIVVALADISDKDKVVRTA